MSENFIDYVKIYCRSGHGGKGAVHFFRDRMNSRGGPDGGDGGRGAHVILQANRQLWTLLHLKYRKHIHAPDGDGGGDNGKTGASGEDIILEVPLGTMARDAETGEVFFELTEDGEKRVLLPGGRGGLGNQHFASAARQTPRYAQPGEDGQERTVILELKVLADVGLVGFPNAGKSTLLSVVSAARPKIADYAFTTLVPNLGVVDVGDYRSFVMADIPGIIEGAAEGRGLGLRFLKHIERNPLLLFMIPADAEDIMDQYRTLLSELESFAPDLLRKRRLLAISKADILDDELTAAISETLPEDVPHLFFSSITRKGLQPLLEALWRMLGKG